MSPSKRAFEKYKPQGLFSEFYGILPRFLPVYVQAKFWDRLLLPQILAVFKLPTTKIDVVDFIQILLKKQAIPCLVTY